MKGFVAINGGLHFCPIIFQDPSSLPMNIFLVVKQTTSNSVCKSLYQFYFLIMTHFLYKYSLPICNDYFEKITFERLQLLTTFKDKARFTQRDSKPQPLSL